MDKQTKISISMYFLSSRRRQEEPVFSILYTQEHEQKWGFGRQEFCCFLPKGGLWRHLKTNFVWNLDANLQMLEPEHKFDSGLLLWDGVSFADYQLWVLSHRKRWDCFT